MQNKLAELTEKLYGEGLEKGRSEAETLVANAQSEAKAIVGKARREADALLAAAQKDADTVKETTAKEVAQAGKNTLNAVKQELENLLLHNALAGVTGCRLCRCRLHAVAGACRHRAVQRCRRRGGVA